MSMRPLDADSWRAASPYLDSALEMTDEARAAWLDALTIEKPEIAAVVALLLEEHRALDRERFLEDAVDVPRPDATSDTTVPGYRLVAPLGHGGMGTVWLAERSDGRYEGRAAVKFLNAGLVGHAIEERFTREGTILARLAHPQIAHLIDAGVSAIGQPYLVLEHVDGQPIDVYCDANRLTIQARVLLFLEVLAPVAHAHANLVVHRDLKPSNVLVTRDGQVKLLDFGIAKLMEDGGGVAHATQITRDGGGAMTPAYAAPEQVIGGAITTATDVYALGVLLYQLLSGRHPAGDATSSPASMLRAIVDAEAPPLAAAARAPGASLDERIAIASARATTADKLRHLLDDDLSAIVLQALRKNAAERYSGVAAFADDLRRYLRHEPISARRDALAYRAAKFVRRHRMPVALTALLLLALVAGLAGTITQARRALAAASIASAQRDFATQQLLRAEALNELNSFVMTGAAPSGAPFTVREMLARAEQVIERQHAHDVTTRVDLMVAVGRQYATQDENGHAYRVLTSAYGLSIGATDESTRAKAACALASTVSKRGERERAEALYQEGIGRLSNDARHALTRIFCYMRGGEASRIAGEADTAVARLEDAQQVLASGGTFTPLMHLRVLMGLAECYRTASRNREADAAFTRAAEQLTQLGYDNTETAETLYNNWALVLGQLGRPVEAEARFRKAIAISSADGTDERVSPFVLNNLARVLEDLERPAEALEYSTRAYHKGQAAGNQVVTLQSLIGRAANHRKLGDFARADAMLAELAAGAAKLWPPVHPGVGALFFQQALLAHARGNVDAALDAINRAIAIGDAIPDTFRLPRMLLARADIHLDMKQPHRARADALRALDAMRAGSDPAARSAEAGRAYLALGRALARLGRPADAARALADAVEHLAVLGAEHPDAAIARQLATGTSAQGSGIRDQGSGISLVQGSGIRNQG